jgi:hypothetical protein
MGVKLDRQVQCSVGKMEVLGSLGTVSEASDGDLTEDRHELTVVARLDGVVGDSLCVCDRRGTHFTLGAQVEVVLEQLAGQVARLGYETDLELSVRQRLGLVPMQEADKTAEDGL